MLTTKEQTVNPALSTFFLNRSKSTTLPVLKDISKVYVLKSASTFDTKSRVLSDLLMALLHILHVSPLACKETVLTWAFAITDTVMAIKSNICFIFKKL